MLTNQEIRGKILEIARRRQKPGTGSSHEFLRRRTAMKQWPNLTDVLGDILWATVGGVAIRHYAPERATIDLNVLIERASRSAARAQLEQDGFQYLGELTIGGSTWTAPDGTGIDALESDEPWAADALREAFNNRDLQGLPVLPLPFFILMKLRSGRAQDVADITRMLGQAGEADLNEVRAVICRHERDAFDDVESMITLGRLEFE